MFQMTVGLPEPDAPPLNREHTPCTDVEIRLQALRAWKLNVTSG